MGRKWIGYGVISPRVFSVFCARPSYFTPRAYKDESGRRRCVKGFTDKSEAMRMATLLEEKAKRVRLGLEKAETDNPEDAPLHRCIADFEKHLSNRESTKKQQREVLSKIRRISTAAGWSKISDINATGLEDALGEFRAQGLSKQTSNHYLQGMRQFIRWLVSNKRVSEDPFADVRKLNVQTDRRHDRRPLSADEFERLVNAAFNGKYIESIPGPDRAMMYVLSAWTGYRKGEIGSLTLRSLDLEGETPTATIQAEFSKRRRQDVQVLHPEVATHLKNWLASKGNIPKDQILFPVSGKVPGGIERKTAKMMKLDLEAARHMWLEEACSDSERREREHSDFLTYKDSRGKFADFHANRHTFITNLGRGGVSAKTAQTLARHSDVRLTINTYTHSDLAEQVDAVSRLPAVPVLRSTGMPSKDCSNPSVASRKKNSSAPVPQLGQNVPDLSLVGETSSKSAEAKVSTEELTSSEVEACCPPLAVDVRNTAGLTRFEPQSWPLPRGFGRFSWQLNRSVTSMPISKKVEHNRHHFTEAFALSFHRWALGRAIAYNNAVFSPLRHCTLLVGELDGLAKSRSKLEFHLFSPVSHSFWPSA